MKEKFQLSLDVEVNVSCSDTKESVLDRIRISLPPQLHADVDFDPEGYNFFDFHDWQLHWAGPWHKRPSTGPGFPNSEHRDEIHKCTQCGTLKTRLGWREDMTFWNHSHAPTT